jgi:hypothetical protein
VPNEEVPPALPTVIVGKICPGITSTIPKANPPPLPALEEALPPPPITATPIWNTFNGTTNVDVVAVIRRAILHSGGATRVAALGGNGVPYVPLFKAALFSLPNDILVVSALY